MLLAHQSLLTANMPNVSRTIKRLTKSIKKYYTKLLSIKHLDLYLFLFSFIAIIIVKFLQFPSLTYNAEMFVESATNFFINAHKFDALRNLITTDAGYLPITQRIISLILVQIFHVDTLFPFISQLIAIIFIAAVSSILNFSIFKNIHPQASVRFILGITIALISDYELNAFINFIYYGALLLFLFMFINKERINKILLVFLSLIASMIILSKGQMIVFLPIFLLLLLFHFRKKEYQSFMFYLLTVIAGFIQIGVMLTSLSHSAAGQKSILFLIYYAIKTIYYFILTYRHVFVGYVTKEGASLIGILILAILFFIAIRAVLKQKDTQTLYIFLAGNFIAICSLFLTVVVLNNNVNPAVKNIANTISNTKVSQNNDRKEQQISTDVRSYKNIFDIKHFANLRSLYISNLLIFLTGTLLLLKIFPKKSHKIIALLVLFYTSGAFGQIRVEEVYATKSQSYSQWAIYNKLLERDDYCIPINHYPALLKQNCDYLLYKNQDELVTNTPPVENIRLTSFTPDAKKWKVRAVILINKPNQFTTSSSYVLYSLDPQNKVLAKAKQLTPSNYDFIYYLFDKPVTNIDKLIWKDTSNKPVKIVPSIVVFGTDNYGTNRKIEY